MKFDRAALLVGLLSVFAWAPLLSDAYFLKAHDAAHSLIFVVQLDQSLRDGAFLPRWGTDFALGYGYPLYVVYNPLSAALAEVFNLAGLGVVGGVKGVFLLGFVGSGLAMYLFVRALYGPAAGVLAGVVYTYLPYRFVDVYVRAAAAEALAFVFPPLVLWATYRLSYPRAHRLFYALGGGLAFAGLVLTHNGTTFQFTLLLALWCAYLVVRTARAGWPAVARLIGWLGALGAVALGVSAAFWLPLLSELKYVREEQWTGYPFADHFVYPFQFLSPFWGYGYSDAGVRDEMAFQVGAIAVVLAVFALRRLRGGPGRGETAFFLATAAIFLVLMTPAAYPVWAAFSFGSLFQFPWRLLGMTAVAVAVLAGAADPLSLWERARVRARPLAPHKAPGSPAALAPLLLLGVVAAQSYAVPESTPVKASDVAPRAVVDFELTWADRTGVTAFAAAPPKTTPLVDQYRNDRPLQKAIAADPEARVEMRHHGGSSDVFRVETPRPTQLTILTYDFPGWNVYLDGRPVPHSRATPQALIAVEVPAGTHEVAARFEHTPARVLGEAVSGLSLLGCVAGFIWLWHLRRRARLSDS